MWPWIIAAAVGTVAYAILSGRSREFVAVLVGPNLVKSGWGDDRSYRGGTHEGVDLPVPTGTKVRAAHSGEVITAGEGTNTGLYIAIERGDGVVTRYMHLSTMWVRDGQYVQAGQVIGESGATGTKSASPHLHFDTLWPISRLGAYEARYGRPKGGFGTQRGALIAVPSEPLLTASFTPTVLQRSRARGVSI